MTHTSSHSAARCCPTRGQQLCRVTVGALCLATTLGACIVPGDGASAPGQDASLQPDAMPLQCNAKNGYIPETVPDGCVVEPSRWVSTMECGYSNNITRVAEVVLDRATFDAAWPERHSGGPGDYVVPLPDKPAIDFTRERVIWHSFYVGSSGRVLAPQVLRCGDVIVVTPRVLYFGGDMAWAAFTLATIAQGDTPVVFEEAELFGE